LERYPYAEGEGVSAVVEFQEMFDGRWVGYLICHRREPVGGVPYANESLARLHECPHDDGGDTAGDRSPALPHVPLRSIAVERDI
jgi:hypothetical protein